MAAESDRLPTLLEARDVPASPGAVALVAVAVISVVLMLVAVDPLGAVGAQASEAVAGPGPHRGPVVVAEAVAEASSASANDAVARSFLAVVHW